MKLSRDELKQIIKECMVEIFSESFSNQQVFETKKIVSHSLKNNVPQKRIVEKNNNVPQQRVSLIKTGNPILDSVIADTARTTLPNMLEAESKKGAQITANGPAERIVANTEPENLFGEETASKWAALAFGDFSSKS